MSGPVKVDVLVVGSGAAGLSAAVTAAMHGASVMVAEKASVLGGTSAWSGGWLWIPRNPLARAEGIDEAADAPLTYLQHEMGSRRYSSANLPALRAGDGGIFPSADGGAVSLGQRHAGLSPVAGCGERWAVGHRATLRWPPARRLAPSPASATGNH